MSHNGWEHGSIILPASESAKLRQTLQNADTKHKDKVFNLTQEFWKGLSRKEQTDRGAYLDAKHRFIMGKARANSPSPQFNWGYQGRPDPDLDQVIDDASAKLEIRWGRNKPARVLKSEMDYPTNRTTDFSADEGHISFNRDKNTVEWSVPENNHAVENAHNHPIAGAFFTQLQQVKWTRNSGGVLSGNDEYNEDNRDAGGGANYVTTAYGPIGADEAPTQCVPYTDSKGRKVTSVDLNRRAGERFQAQWDLQRKIAAAGARRAKTSSASNRGSFAPNSHSEPNFRL